MSEEFLEPEVFHIPLDIEKVTEDLMSATLALLVRRNSGEIKIFATEYIAFLTEIGPLGLEIARDPRTNLITIRLATEDGCTCGEEPHLVSCPIGYRQFHEEWAMGASK